MQFLRVSRSPNHKRHIQRNWNGWTHRVRRWGRRGRWVRRKLTTAPRAIRVGFIATAVIAIFSGINLAYQVVHKPSELLFPLSDALTKTPAETWQQYRSLFREYSTKTISPVLLAALAQVESGGNPLANAYWRWRLTWHPFAIYAPASSSVGMYQMTDAAFDEARHYCIQGHVVVEASCWFNSLYTRLIPSDAIELAAVYLDRNVTMIRSQQPHAAMSSRRTDELAAVIQLCGAGPAAAFVHHGFRLMPGERCGEELAATYIGEVNIMKEELLHVGASLAP